MLRRLIAGAALAVTAIGIGAAAQDTAVTPIYCGTLSADDCAILQQSQTASMTLDSASFTFDGGITLDNVGGLPDGTHTIALTGSGSYFGALTAMPMMGMTDPAAAIDPMVQLEVLRTALANLDARLDTNISVPPALIPQGAEFFADLDINLLLVDGIGYIDFAPFVAIEPNMAEFFPSGYAGLDLIDTLNALEPLMTASNMGDIEAMGLDMQTLQTFSDPAYIGQFTTYTREADMTGEGSDVLAVYTATIDLGALVRDPAYADLLRQTVTAQGQTLSEEQLQEAITAVSSITDAIDYSVTTRISTSSYFVNEITVSLALNLDAIRASMVEMGAQSQDELTGTVAFDLTLRYSDFNAATAPMVGMDTPVVTFNELAALFGLGGMPAPSGSMMTPTPTPVVAGPTPEPTAESTAEATPELTPEATLELTLEPTVEVTVELTEPIILGPTPSPTVAS